MSRRWERMVEKNKKVINKQRSKRGQVPISQAGQEAMRTFRGRSWALPLFLIGFAVFFVLIPGRYYNQDGWYWTTILMYVALALFIFTIRRPFLRIGKTKLVSRRFGGDRTVEPGEVDEILLMKGHVVIQLKHRKTKWIFSRSLQRFDIGELAQAVKEYAQRNGVVLKDEIGTNA